MLVKHWKYDHWLPIIIQCCTNPGTILGVDTICHWFIIGSMTISYQHCSNICPTLAEIAILALASNISTRLGQHWQPVLVKHWKYDHWLPILIQCCTNPGTIFEVDTICHWFIIGSMTISCQRCSKIGPTLAEIAILALASNTCTRLGQHWQPVLVKHWQYDHWLSILIQCCTNPATIFEVDTICHWFIIGSMTIPANVVPTLAQPWQK